MTVRFAVFVPPAKAAVIVGVPAATVVTENVALELPLGMLTDAGTVAEALLEARVTFAPPEPAGQARLTVAWTAVPAVTLAELKVRLLNDTLVHEGVVGVAGVFFEQLAVNSARTSTETPVAVSRGLIMATPSRT